MKTKYFPLLFLLMIPGSLLRAQEKAYQPPFREGEKLTYLLHYGIVNGGKGSLEVKKTRLNGSTVYHAAMKANTIGIADKLYKVEDVYETYMSPLTGLPVKAVRNIREGKYRYYNESFFYRDSSVVYSQKSGYHQTPEGIIDMVSAVYYLRSYPKNQLHVGDTISLVTYFADEIYPLHLRYRGKETIKSKLGDFRCYLFAPVTEPGRVFETEDDMLIWFTDDQNFIPVRVQFDMWVGSMKVDLIEYSGLAFPLTSKRD